MPQWEAVCPPVKEKQVQSLNWEDALEEEMATHPGILAWRRRTRGDMDRGTWWATVHRVTKNQT